MGAGSVTVTVRADGKTVRERHTLRGGETPSGSMPTCRAYACWRSCSARRRTVRAATWWCSRRRGSTMAARPPCDGRCRRHGRGGPGNRTRLRWSASSLEDRGAARVGKLALGPHAPRLAASRPSARGGYLPTPRRQEHRRGQRHGGAHAAYIPQPGHDASHQPHDGREACCAVSGEGFITIDGRRWSVGGLAGQPERAYLKPEWIEEMTTLPDSFVVEDFRDRRDSPTLEWARNRWALNKEDATGREIVFTLRGSGALADVTVRCISPYMTRSPSSASAWRWWNGSAVPLNVDSFNLEYLAFAEPESPSGGDPDTFLLPNIHIESDYNCKGKLYGEGRPTSPRSGSRTRLYVAAQLPDADALHTDVSPALGPTRPWRRGRPSRRSASTRCPFRQLRPRAQGAFTRRFYRAVAPWTTENPIFLHLTSSNPKPCARPLTSAERRATR